MRIGFSGHRPNRLRLASDRIAARLSEALDAIVDERKGRAADVVAISLLAEGSDRMFAEVALAHGFTLHAMLPFRSSDYERTFEDAAGTQAYRRLLSLAAQKTELPGDLSDSTAAYEAVGAAMVDACDAVVTVWDGKPAAGRGGTPEVIGYALKRGLAVIWVNAGEDRAPVRLIEMTPVIRTAPLRP